MGTVWNVHLTFTPKQWSAMEPKGAPGGGPMGGGGNRPRGMFGPGMFLAPAFVKAGDADNDSKLSANEFRALGEKWFAQWDKEKRGKVNSDQLKAGLTETFPPPAPGGGGPRPPGAPGAGPGRGGPGASFLQAANGKRNGLSGAAGIDFDYVNAALEFAGRQFQDVAVRYKGNGTFMQSRGSEKRSLKVDLNKFEKGQKIATVTTLNLHNCVTDPSWMNEVLSYRLFRDAAVPAPRTAYARVHITVPGKFDRRYFGLYSLIENPDKNFVEELFGTKKGALFKPVTPQLFSDLGEQWESYQQIYDPKTDLKPAEKQRVIDFAQLASHADDASFAEKLGEFLDLDEFARFMSVTVWLATLDSILGPGQNYYLYLHPKTDKFVFIPWDLDHSFGQFFLMGNQTERDNLNIHKPWRGENRFLDRVFKVEAFKTRYLAQMAEFTKTIFQPARFHRQVDELAAVLRPAVADESNEKLARFDKVVAGEPAPPAPFPGAPPAPATTPSVSALGTPRDKNDGQASNAAPRAPGPGRGGFGFPPAIPPIKPFVVARAQSVADQLAGKRQGDSAGEFGPPRGPGGGPPGGGPGNFLARPFMSALDADKDGEVSNEECVHAFSQWFDSWDGEKRGIIGEDQLRAGLDRDLFRPR
ncbi:MAG TPA: CotH kinase family protein [Chthoniobacteraceae bacterium]|nr:CotH kinase family protein [Chthoniobacteraceae bacterium]